MNAFLRKYPLVKVVVLNVLAVLAYDTLSEAPTRTALRTAAHSLVRVPAVSLPSVAADVEPQLAMLVL